MTFVLSEIGVVVKVPDSHFLRIGFIFWQKLQKQSQNHGFVAVFHVFWSACKLLNVWSISLGLHPAIEYQVDQYTHTHF